MALVPRAALLLGLVLPGITSCQLIEKDISFPEDMAGKNVIGISSGWAFVEAKVNLENGQGPLADPILGGSDSGSSTTTLDPVFGVGIKYLRYITNNWLVGVIYEYRIFDPQSTRPLNADVDIDSFGTNHFIIEGRYQFDPIDKARRFRPFVSVQLGIVPEVTADGTVSYESIPALGIPATQEQIRLNGSSFITLGFVAGGSYLIREALTLDFSIFYEYAITPTEDVLTLNPYPNNPPLDQPTTYDGELFERGLYLTMGLSYVF
ncbi:MAG: hypothetical protein AAF957_02465 [Planctomycetota bacterium]